ncbi:MAG: hypothetical protein QME63_01085 [Actinomycetota bacterium]|nr:hypothetical protein [Actinomycetota bacterium]
MSFVMFAAIINFFLASLAALISFGIIRKVTGDLALSWRYSFIAFQILALSTLLTAIYELGIRSVAGISLQLLTYISHFVFVILAFFGLLYQYRILKGLTDRGVK